MAYDEALARRVRTLLANRPEIAERRMFGGVAFLRHGLMFAGLTNDTLMLRLGKEAATAALARPHVRPMDFTGRPMQGYVYVDPDGLRGTALRAWLERAEAFVSTLPPKALSGPAAPPPRSAPATPRARRTRS